MCKKSAKGCLWLLGILFLIVTIQATYNTLHNTPTPPTHPITHTLQAQNPQLSNMGSEMANGGGVELWQGGSVTYTIQAPTDGNFTLQVDADAAEIYNNGQSVTEKISVNGTDIYTTMLGYFSASSSITLNASFHKGTNTVTITNTTPSHNQNAGGYILVRMITAGY
jgi:hypothetical protein